MCNLQGALASPDIQEIVDQDGEINRALKDLQDPMDNCRLACDRVMRKLIPHLQLEDSAHKGSGDGSKRRMRRGDVMWFWRRREVFALMTDLERTKAMFSDAMKVLHCKWMTLMGQFIPDSWKTTHIPNIGHNDNLCKCPDET